MTPAQGSPRNFSTDFLVIGQLGRAHGVKGEIRMSLLTDFPERLQCRGGSMRTATGSRLAIDGQMGVLPHNRPAPTIIYIGEQHKPVRITNCRGIGHPSSQEVMLVTFEGYNDREKVETLRSQMVYVRTDERPPLPEGEYYQHQLLGLQVTDEDGKALGVLVDILRTGANDVYIIKAETGREILCPAIDSTILGVDLEQGEMRVHLLPGLMED